MKEVIFVLLALFGLASSAPNFIVLMADDAGYGDLGNYGAPTIVTPNLDKMAKEGTKFTQWYNAAPICTPSRGATLTGRLPGRMGLYTKYDYPLDYVFRVFYPSSVGSLPESEITIAERLKQKNYFSACIGKWHLGHHNALPTRRGFDYFFGTPYSHDEGYPGPFPMALIWPPVPLYQNETIIEQPLDLNTLTSKMTQEALYVIEESTAKKQPFFLYMSYHEPHIPLFSEKRFQGVSRRGGFGDMMFQMDDSIGTIMNKLKQLNIDEQTMVVFLSDNGAWPDAQEPFTFDHDLIGEGGSNGPFFEGKGSTWEGGVRGPAIVRWPKNVPADRVTMEVASHLDLFPTFLDLAGIPLPTDRVIDGKSLVPLLLGNTEQSPHESLFFWRETTLMAVRHGPYKAHFVTRSGFDLDPPVVHDPPLLFQVEADPSEREPLNVEDFPGVLQEILKVAEKHKSEMVFPVSQYDLDHEGPIPGNSWKVIPCCQKNLAELESQPDNEHWSLIVWRDCICPNSVGRGTLKETFEPMDKMLQKKYYGKHMHNIHQLLESSFA